MQPGRATGVSTNAPRSDANWKRYLPLAVIALGAIAAISFGRDFLTFEALAEHYDTLIAWRDNHWLATVAVFVMLYIFAVAFSVPGATWLTLIGGFLFGTWLGAALVIPAATFGAVLIFLAARTALGDALRQRAGRWIEPMEQGFRKGEVSYLLIMRLVPAVPFFVANLAPAFFGARLWTYVWTTFAGIIPGTVVYISIGAGLGEQLARGEAPDLGVIFQPHVLGPLLGLAALAALPLILKKLGVFRNRSDG
ncbi:MAG: TVP38/TMEM64 family protein [Paracoccaceae bacterium]